MLESAPRVRETNRKPAHWKKPAGPERLLARVDQWWGFTHKGSVDAKRLGKIASEWFLARGGVFVPGSGSALCTGSAASTWRPRRARSSSKRSRPAAGCRKRRRGCTPERNELAVHTHDDEDRIVVVVVGEKGMRVVPNASGPCCCGPTGRPSSCATTSPRTRRLRVPSGPW